MLKSDLKKALFISAFFIALLFTSTGQALNCPAEQINASAKVRYVYDGDTVKLQDGRKIRLLGIDTPELARKQQPEQPFAKQAKLALQQLIQNNQQRIALAYGPEKYDKYKRTLAHLYLDNGDSIQAQLLKQGLAIAYTTPPNIHHSHCYQQAEKLARQKNTGLWALPQYQIKNLSQLTKQDRGFRRIQGRVSQVYSSRKSDWIQLGNTVKIQIRNKDLIYFNRQQLKQLTGKTIILRGWLHPNKKSFYMNLRHPDNMRLSPTSTL